MLAARAGLVPGLPLSATIAPPHSLFEMATIMTRLLEEIEDGLLTTVENRAIAVTFDDFPDHGVEYLKHGRKDEAAVIAGIVFEDTIRRICRVLEIPENNVALDTLISELTKGGVLIALKAKRARAAAGLRTSAAHARWEEIQLSDEPGAICVSAAARDQVGGPAEDLQRPWPASVPVRRRLFLVTGKSGRGDFSGLEDLGRVTRDREFEAGFLRLASLLETKLHSSRSIGQVARQWT